MKEKNQNPLLAVLKREIDRMISRRFYFGVTIILPLFCILFMATIFNNGQMENIPIGVVDMDGTATSRNIIRNV
ncbi:MAG: ABC transporter permease, partial [Bacteroidales bacterium]